jgi:DNA-binding transcriptional ArsR family regulator
MKDKKNSSLEVMQRNAHKAEKMLKLLANKNRLMILCHLVKGEKSVGQLVNLVGISSSALSQHLSKMKKENLLKDNKQGQMVYYRIINPEVEAVLSTLYLIYCNK